jgi:hypothetical protein
LNATVVCLLLLLLLLLLPLLLPLCAKEARSTYTAATLHLQRCEEATWIRPEQYLQCCTIHGRYLFWMHMFTLLHLYPGLAWPPWSISLQCTAVSAAERTSKSKQCAQPGRSHLLCLGHLRAYH